MMSDALYPIIIKLTDTGQKCSVHVHPTDEPDAAFNGAAKMICTATPDPEN